MDLFIAGRRHGKTFYILQKFIRELAEGRKPKFVCFNEPERRRVLDLVRALKPPDDVWVDIERAVTTVDRFVRDRHGVTEGPVFIDNLDIVLQHIFGPVVEATGTNINLTVHQEPNPYVC